MGAGNRLARFSASVCALARSGPELRRRKELQGLDKGIGFRLRETPFVQCRTDRTLFAGLCCLKFAMFYTAHRIDTAAGLARGRAKGIYSRAALIADFKGQNVEPQPPQNHLLEAIPAAEAQRWLPLLESVELPLGSVLYESGGTLSHVYFPTSAIVSLLYVLENGASAEIAVVGNEGVVGISLFMGGESTPSRAVVQSAGNGLRLRAPIMKEEFNRAGAVLHLMLRYTQALITQMAQTAVCNRHHSLDQQLCRWLLLSLDRLQGNELVMTQELIANMLGVRREGVTEGALKLQHAGLIQYARGHITVLDRAGLEKRSCECYAVVKKEYDRLLPHAVAH
jgi:CRP-like cAMP-binding protein